jgi:hypothetical protein
VLLIGGLLEHRVQQSISSYYTDFRNYFTGTMCVIGVFLLFYRYSNWPISGRFHWFAREIKVGRELLPRLAGGAALGVAFFHTAPAAQEQLMKIHLGCAITYSRF